MDRPREKITRKTIMMSYRLKELELKENVSKSLMANVLDMDDDFRLDVQSGSPSHLLIVGRGTCLVGSLH